MSNQRWGVLVGPRGDLTCLPVGDPRRKDRYRRWTEILRINRPMTRRLVHEAQLWAVQVLKL